MSPEAAAAAAQELAHELLKLKTTYAALWDRENRPWWKDRILERYDVMVRDLETLTSN